MRQARYQWVLLVAALSAIATVATTTIALGGGIEVPMQSARAAGEADAYTAQADDPSAIFYNPAGLTQLKGTELSVGALYLQPNFHFDGDNGSSEGMHLPSILPHFYLSSDFGTECLRLGFGINDVYGINEDWGDRGPLRTLVDKAQLSVINFAPTVAYRVDSHLSLGIAFNFYYGTLDLQRNAVLAAPPVPEGSFRLKGYASAFGVTPSLMYKIDDRDQIGLYYRSPFTMDFGGSARLTSTVIPKIGPSPANESLNFPQSVGLGYARRFTDQLTVEGDVIWTDWHTVDQLKINSSNPAFNDQVLPAKWKSGFTFRLGGEYKLTQQWSIRAGYAYSQNSVPESTFSPLVPDSNYHLGSLGVGYTRDKWSLDLAYEFIYREQRHIHNETTAAVDGTWDNTIQGLMLTFSYRL